MSKIFNKSYFEDGLTHGVSCYENYRWMPEMTIKLAHKIAKKLKFNENDVILDYGCAKGYFVKALRILDYNAYGCDISHYAIKNADKDVEKYCYFMKNNILPRKIIQKKPNWLLTKDVLEHMSLDQINKLLEQTSKAGFKNMFHVIPLGDNGTFRIKEYHLDKTHIQIKDEKWWIKKFKEYGWVGEVSFFVDGIKEKWTKKKIGGDGFFKLKRK